MSSGNESEAVAADTKNGKGVKIGAADKNVIRVGSRKSEVSCIGFELFPFDSFMENVFFFSWPWSKRTMSYRY